MIYASLLIVIAVHILLFRKRGLLDPISVFFLAFLYYSYFTPISMQLFDQYDTILLGNISYITIETIDSSAIIFALGYISFAVAYFLFSKSENFGGYIPKNTTTISIVKDNYARTLFAFIIIIATVIVTFFSSELINATSSYEGKIGQNYTSSTYAFILGMAFTILSLLANYTILNVRNYALVSMFAILLFAFLAILTFSKAPFIFAALCAFCFLYRYKRLPYSLTMSTLIVAAVVATMFVIPAFSIFRASGEFAITIPNRDSLPLILSEASGPFSIMHFALNGYISADAHPLWHSFTLWIPRAIWADRPLDIAEGFARQVIVSWQAGLGLGFSPFAEGYARYGTYGSALFMALMGAISAIIQSIFAKFVPQEMRIPAMLTIGGLVSVMVLRGAFSGLFTQSLQNWVPIILISLVAHEISQRIDTR
jgi:oligosaccharide repeat unit polymerase